MGSDANSLLLEGTGMAGAGLFTFEFTYGPELVNLNLKHQRGKDRSRRAGLNFWGRGLNIGWAKMV